MQLYSTFGPEKIQKFQLLIPKNVLQLKIDKNLEYKIYCPSQKFSGYILRDNTHHKWMIPKEYCYEFKMCSMSNGPTWTWTFEHLGIILGASYSQIIISLALR